MNAAETKERLRADLRKALKEKRGEAAVLRTLIAALDNAEAPPLENRTGSDSEILRLELSPDQVQAILLAEFQERQRSAAQYRELGLAARADAAGAEAEIVRRYLG
ncbi:GatB/YqeY domain-containing protein [Pelagibacterium sp. 26DY04]|uniref:GatB/YqeY domain-containing protein n=1 Tax=unclassified Pelagibacterium TaxID=2623280 RepID=UPI002816990C|nr:MULTISPECIES: GatB/YqeY domain-containing protein [unclassified Pelagibacterium]WMT85806.1 GatB/YqeY domain-containing protein [Pelagibacterium sp. 26DY04]WMT89909.1 GatB/YqeY domain-containing protein [Pelagibacterium sp. H642]